MAIRAPDGANKILLDCVSQNHNLFLRVFLKTALDRSSNVSVFKLTAHKIGEVIFAALALHLQAKTGGGLGDLRWQLSNASVTNFPQRRLPYLIFVTGATGIPV